MNKANAAQYLPLVQALADGKTIEYRMSKERWEVRADPAFMEKAENYRIKPEPIERWGMINSKGNFLGIGTPAEFTKEDCQKQINELIAENKGLFDDYRPILMREVIE